MLLCDQQQIEARLASSRVAIVTHDDSAGDATNNSYADFPAATSYQSELDAMNHAQHLQLHQQQIQQQSQPFGATSSRTHCSQHRMVSSTIWFISIRMQQSATWSRCYLAFPVSSRPAGPSSFFRFTPGPELDFGQSEGVRTAAQCDQHSVARLRSLLTVSKPACDAAAACLRVRDTAACQHYGVRTCEGCKGFFKGRII
uniref:Nuclear receptor domain-containing protein n=1 Tax=Macrostomum lignano TaxID=282301 RepID=A0A1I8JS27_9PLAT